MHQLHSHNNPLVPPVQPLGLARLSSFLWIVAATSLNFAEGSQPPEYFQTTRPIGSPHNNLTVFVAKGF